MAAKETAAIQLALINVLAIDPGSEQSAFLYWIDGKPKHFGIQPNRVVRDSLQVIEFGPALDVIAIEMVACYGMPVGKEVFETCLWIGRFIERAPIEPRLIYRRDIKLHHCGNVRAKDANVRQSILDRFGGKDKAIGTKKSPGILYGIKSHLWQCLALALFVADTQ